MSLARDDALETYYRNMEDQDILVPVSNMEDLNEQEIFARLHHNRIYLGKNVVDKVGGMSLYKHQVLASRLLFSSDSLLVIHEPGTGKTKTNLNAMMALLTAKAILEIYIINKSELANKVAIVALEEIYNTTYRPFYNLTYNQFRGKYIRTLTLSKIHDKPYGDNVGIIIDEAHNIMTDNDNDKPKKTEYLEQFISILSRKKGIKLILASATPIFGKTDNLYKLRQILFRSKVMSYEDVPQSMVSCTKINYDHLKAEQMLNPYYDNEFGNPGIRDFEMSNGKIFPFRLYEEIPSPMQIADFTDLILSNEKDTFQSKVRPIIIQSDRKKRLTSESSILSDVIEKIKSTKDGTAIIYSSLKENGALAIAKILDDNGFENCIKKQSSSTNMRSIESLKISGRINKMIREIASMNQTVIDSLKDDTKTTEKHFKALLEQLMDFDDADEDKEIFKMYVDSYEKRLIKDLKLRESINSFVNKIADYKEKIKALKLQNELEKKEKPKLKYLIYTSGMSTEAKKAFLTFNSEENWDGSLIKVIIGSQVLRDGVNIFHATQTFILISEWRMAGNIQAQFRGFRSNGHDALIHNRAILKSEALGISYNEAKRIIRQEKIIVEIYYHALDFKLLTIDDIEGAKKYMGEDAMKFIEEEIEDFISENPEYEDDEEEIAKHVNFRILQELQNDSNRFNGGMKLYESAIEKHITVGAELMKLQASSIDYMLNVRQRDRIVDAINEEEKERQSVEITSDKFLGVKNTELFFMNDYLEMIIGEITKYLLIDNVINTDNLIDQILRGNELLSVEMISTAIMELVKIRKYIYNPRLGIEIYVKLMETENESILYLTTNPHDVAIHPYNSHVEKIGYTVPTEFEVVVTTVTEKDLEFPKNDSTFFKLRDAIQLLMRDERVDTYTYRFLEQMSNYWAFDWRDIENIGRDSKVYLFKTHISNPSSNVTADNLDIHEYNPATGRWKKTSTSKLKNVVFIRYITLFKKYLKFNFGNIAEFIKKSDTGTDVKNGFAIIKSVYEPRMNEELYIDKLLNSHNVLPNNVLRNVISRKSNKSKAVGSKGTQLSIKDLEAFRGVISEKESLKKYFEAELEKSPYFIFFLYNSDELSTSGNESIFDIKKYEAEVMNQAINGTPTLRFQIEYVERIIKDEERKKEIYKKIYA
jgi:hypothetical protein